MQMTLDLGRQPYAPKLLNDYNNLIKKIKDLLETAKTCKDEIMKVSYNMVGLNQTSIAERSAKYAIKRDTDSKRKSKSRKKRKAMEVDDHDVIFDMETETNCSDYNNKKNRLNDNNIE